MGTKWFTGGIVGVWRPRLGNLVFLQVRYSRLIGIADSQRWSKKTYNNVVSVLKHAFGFGYRDRPFHENPALNLRCARLRKSRPTQNRSVLYARC